MFALDAISGKILWSYKRGVPPGTTNQSSASPIVVGQQLVVGFADGSLVSFNKFDGQMNWEKNLAEKIKFNDPELQKQMYDGAEESEMELPPDADANAMAEKLGEKVMIEVGLGCGKKASQGGRRRKSKKKRSRRKKKTRRRRRR